MSKARDSDLPQHHMDQGHWGEMSLDLLPSGSHTGHAFTYISGTQLWGVDFPVLVKEDGANEGRVYILDFTGALDVQYSVGRAVISGTGGGPATDEKVKVSSNDTVAEYLIEKLVAGTNVSIVENNNGGDESLTIQVTSGSGGETVKGSANDTTANYLIPKISGSGTVALYEYNNGGNEIIVISGSSTGGPDADERVKVTSNDTTADYLFDKLIAGTNVTIVENNDGGEETITILVTSGSGTDDKKTQVTINDTTPDYLYHKVSGSGTVSTYEYYDGSNEVLVVSGSGAGTVAVPTLLESVKVSADTPDDEFDDTFAGWTDVDGTEGTVSLLASSGAGVYDLATRPGWLLAQVGTASGDGVTRRQDYTLPDGKCIVGYFSLAGDIAAAQANNELWFGLAVNDNDTAFDAGAAGQTAALMFDTDTGGSRAIGWDGTGIIGQNYSANDEFLMSDGAFFRIDRSGLVYNLFWSKDGFSWSFVGSKTMASAADNLWWFAECRATMANRMVVGSPWFRQGTALAIDPWPL